MANQQVQAQLEDIARRNVGGAQASRACVNRHVGKHALEAAGLPVIRENGMQALRHKDASLVLGRRRLDQGPRRVPRHNDRGFTLRTYTTSCHPARPAPNKPSTARS